MKEYLDKAKNNATNIDTEIRLLENSHWSFGIRIYKDFWSHVKAINEMFKNTKPILKEDRDRFWERFTYICNDVKRQQNNEYIEREIKSKSYYEDIMRLIRSSYVNTFFGFDTIDIEKMHMYGNFLRKASEMLSEHKDKMTAKHKQECFNEIQNVRKNHDAWWKALKIERQQKKEAFISRVRDNLEKNLEKHRKAAQTLEKLRDQRQKLQNDIASAWSDNFRDKVYRWLTENDERMRDVERYIEKLEIWIAEDESKLR